MAELPVSPPPTPITPADQLFVAVPRCPQGHLLLMYADQRTGQCSRCAQALPRWGVA